MSDIPVKLDARTLDELQSQLLVIFRDIYEERVVTNVGVLTPLYFIYTDTDGNLKSSAIAISALSGTNTGNQTITLTGDVTGSGTASFATTISPSVMTTAGRALVDDATAAEQRTTLGLGSIATQAASSVAITGGTISGVPDSAVARVTTQFDKANVTLATVTELSRNVVSGNTYAFQAALFVDASAIGGSRYSIAGTCTASAIIYHVLLIDDTLGTNTITKRETALGANNATQAGTITGLCVIEGLITASGSGTLTVQFAQSVADGISSVLVGSSFAVNLVS